MQNPLHEASAKRIKTLLAMKPLWADVFLILQLQVGRST